MAIQTPPTIPTGQQDWHGMKQQESAEWRTRYHEAGVPFWGLLLILIGGIALLGNFGLSVGWVFGLALGVWFIYLGVRHLPEGQSTNWWLVGLGLLIGLGSVSSSYFDRLVFPIVLIVVGLGIVAQQYLRRPGR
ncbi:MAG: hypothetical protein ABI670_02150 [Chloroflexota bacterium]